jgi:hypothetical protein
MEASEAGSLLTNKPVTGLMGNRVWFITKEGTGAGGFVLKSMFDVTEVGDTTENGFKHCASGPGHVFNPPIPVGDEPWFAEVLRATGNLAFGVQAMNDASVVGALARIAAGVGRTTT